MHRNTITKNLPYNFHYPEMFFTSQAILQVWKKTDVMQMFKVTPTITNLLAKHSPCGTAAM